MELALEMKTVIFNLFTFLVINTYTAYPVSQDLLQ